ncbi:hypothetical protein ACM46_13580 [Chryseobacterium angstadtii]|uniref:Aspartyl protease n=1 Tax=Chryseobacterium angstadtii TaxID=558151 RepID=A0A0J7L214_9FLAO|nr:hypothetical protein [Chryseobacterium angstadtii]KMQ63225.1 hypothetical protein ACM46_13580 [Chryseobacterium angstadtii]
MKTLKKIVLSFIAVIALSLLGGYFYFDRKFTPPENNLNVSGTAEHIVFTWDVADGNPHAAVLLPVRIKGIEKTFFMQLDSGSPTTLLYRKSLESISKKFQYKLPFNYDQNKVSMQFSMGNMSVASDFELLNYGDTLDVAHPVIGTIGTDLFEKRVLILDFKNTVCSWIENLPGNGLEPLEFKKRKIIFPGSIGSQKLKLLYDSGTSGYELLTNKEEWERYRIPGGSIKKEKGNSWGNVLTVISAPADDTVKIGNRSLPLSEVTYVEGTSKMQNLLMKTSGMQGMIGNKLFLNHTLILDCKNKRFKVE